MRKSLVAGNWKLNGSLSSVDALAEGVVKAIGGVTCDVALCPVALHIERVSRIVEDSAVAVGAQNASDQTAGAYTGEISVAMLKEYGCQYVILGHSERRTLFGETDHQVSLKVQAALQQDLIPILCVGETLEERESGSAETVVERQLLEALRDVERLGDVVVAYEPVWAIGTGLTATPDQAQSMHAFIRNVLAGLSEDLAQKVRVLYGGSVKPGNAAELFGQPDIDGGLIGGASLNVEDFIAICKAAG
jgi:triosephosphate isomerase